MRKENKERKIGRQTTERQKDKLADDRKTDGRTNRQATETQTETRDQSSKTRDGRRDIDREGDADRDSQMSPMTRPNGGAEVKNEDINIHINTTKNEIVMRPRETKTEIKVQAEIVIEEAKP